MEGGADRHLASRSDAPATRLTLLAVWLLGAAAPVARLRLQTARGAAIGAALVACSLAVVWGLSRGGRGMRWSAALTACAVAGVGAMAFRHGFLLPLAVVVAGTVLAFGALVAWPPVHIRGWRRREGPTATLALGPLVAAMLLWFRAPSPITFASLAAISLALLEGAARFPSAVRRLEAGLDRAASATAQLLTIVLGGVVMLVAVVPISLVNRAFRYSPLDSGWAGESSSWITVDPRRRRTPGGVPVGDRRMALLDLEPSRRIRIRSRLRLLLPATIIALVLLLTATDVFDRHTSGSAASATDPGRAGNGTFTRRFEDDPAFQHAPWAKLLRLNLLDAWSNLEFNAAFGGWRIKDISSKYINIKDGERSTLAPDPALGKPITIWFLGGSAAFGAGQRDDHTIPSEIVRRAAAEGIPIAIRNLAVPATVNWQSAMLLIERLRWAPKPDLVVFYDGANDVALQETLSSQGRGRSDEPASLLDGDVDTILREHAAASGQAGAILPPSDPEVRQDPPSPTTEGKLVLSRYRQGVEVVRQFCAASSVPVAFFWQPDLRLKRPLSAADRRTLATVKVDEGGIERQRTISAEIRAGLGGLGVTDLTTVFDGRDEAIYWDTVHTNESGARIAARAIYADLRPQLRVLTATSTSGTGGPGRP